MYVRQHSPASLVCCDQFNTYFRSSNTRYPNTHTHTHAASASHSGRPRQACVWLLCMHFNLCGHWLLTASRWGSHGAYLTTIFRFLKKIYSHRSAHIHTHNRINWMFDTKQCCSFCIDSLTCRCPPRIFGANAFGLKYVHLTGSDWSSVATACVRYASHSFCRAISTDIGPSTYIVAKGAQPATVNCVLLHWIMTF